MKRLATVIAAFTAVAIANAVAFHPLVDVSGTGIPALDDLDAIPNVTASDYGVTGAYTYSGTGAVDPVGNAVAIGQINAVATVTVVGGVVQALDENSALFLQNFLVFSTVPAPTLLDGKHFVVLGFTDAATGDFDVKAIGRIVPEPHEYALLAGMGLLGFAAYRRLKA